MKHLPLYCLPKLSAFARGSQRVPVDIATHSVYSEFCSLFNQRGPNGRSLTDASIRETLRSVFAILQAFGAEQLAKRRAGFEKQANGWWRVALVCGLVLALVAQRRA